MLMQLHCYTFICLQKGIQSFLCRCLDTHDLKNVQFISRMGQDSIMPTYKIKRTNHMHKGMLPRTLTVLSLYCKQKTYTILQVNAMLPSPMDPTQWLSAGTICIQTGCENFAVLQHSFNQGDLHQKTKKEFVLSYGKLAQYLQLQ